jgi:NTE family protein
VNPPLSNAAPADGYDLGNVMKSSAGTSDILLIMAFSGGGTRAAAFSYGVLQEMSETTVGKSGSERPLTREIDFISAVSGGSFTAAYFGLYGDRMFEDYERVFLRRDVQGELTDQLLDPFNWPRIMSPFYTRTDMATQLYDETIFNRATFKDLREANGPFIVINSTEMTLGTRFQFTQNYADIICTDLSEVPVARAVTASSAVPLLFSPVTMVNRAGECNWQEPVWATRALAEQNRSSRIYNFATSIMELSNREEHPYLHLFDGGLADNLGLRAVLDGVLTHDGITQTLEELNLQQTRKVVFILVNAETALDVESSRKMETPTFDALLNAATSVPLQRYSFETVALLKDRLAEWQRQSQEAECGSTPPAAGQRVKSNREDACAGVEFHFVEVNFSEHPDPGERTYLKQLPTSFSLTDEAVDRLIAAGRLILRDNSEYQSLLQ